MASPLRPGGGVLTGATSQEEWLCSRTTLYPSLREEFYRLPEVGAIYTPDVLVCKMWDSEASDLKPADQFFIDVITAAMLRLPDVERNQDGEAMYSEQKDRDTVLRKMRCVMRILKSQRVNRVVLGAWGCGAYGNPVEEIATAWRRVLLGPKSKKVDRGEVYDDLEVVFAIKDEAMAKKFARIFGPEAVFSDDDDNGENGGETIEVADATTKPYS
ncbi:tigr02452 family [Trichoderma arundinaceum]|uniref:Tigr02452 family n=1 Tax=Trichoderma arundinaceum TaxID=490622 RepID=A0A395NP55_TRIAR|nr:tigr02452 family [Trichoderma arundinaceum]